MVIPASKPLVFDLEESVRFVEARSEFLRAFLATFREPLQLKTALDVGCGVGYFSGLLQQLGRGDLTRARLFGTLRAHD